MSISIWGMLSKNFEDPEKIEEAIARMIDSHNKDPQSHLGSNESLAVHRSQESIDHLPKSISADNIKEGAVAVEQRQDKQQEVETLFENIDSLGQYTTGDGYVAFDWPVILLACPNTGIGSVEVYPTGWMSDFCSGDLDWYWQATIELTCILSSDKKAFWGVGFHDDFTPSGDRAAVGFKVHNNKLFAVAANTFEDPPQDVAIEISAIDVSLPHVYRIKWNNDQDRHEFFVNGDLVCTIPTIRGPIAETNGFCLYVETGIADTLALTATDLKVSCFPVPYA